MHHFKNKLNKLSKKDVKIPEKNFVEEHKKLINVLESPSHKDDIKEAKKQRKELQQEMKKSEIIISAYNDGTLDIETGAEVPEEVFNQICSSMAKSFDLVDIEILEKKKKAFQLKSKHKSKKGGLTEAGRKAYNKATGSNLKRPQPGGGKRKKSYCARSKGQMKMHNINCSKTPEKRVCLARRRWACKSESDFYFESLNKRLQEFPMPKYTKEKRISNILKDPKSSFKLLDKIYEIHSKNPYDNEFILADIASHPNTSKQTLRDLYDLDIPSVKDSLINNPNFETDSSEKTAVKLLAASQKYFTNLKKNINC
jgi:hypothetical protein